ncbi:2-dehydro-3-deoxy-6-phosphogalactonate aldolase [bioreactor metagenome]|uniref:2-dehydro-3-deoxy-6-phosphogalactonate aldolase n=1 Tax=bioreactor metagenome TaxID=1076179 RepID=A0A645FDU0_9ZZZZ
MKNFQEQCGLCPVTAILRGITPGEMLDVCELLREAGIRLLEVPLNSPDALESIRRAAQKYHGGDELLAGAGTVLTPEAVRDVAEAGGKFIISPDTNPEVIRETKRLGLVSIPGFLTPTEAFTALRAGADYLKLFPAGALGPGYIKDLKAVVKAPILAVGGVDAGNLPEFLKVCAGAGIGSALYKPGKAPEAIAADARRFVESALHA